MRPIATPGACFQRDHDHALIAARAELVPHIRITLWHCPVKHQLSALLEDERRDPVGIPHGGPLE